MGPDFLIAGETHGIQSICCSANSRLHRFQRTTTRQFRRARLGSLQCRGLYANQRLSLESILNLHSSHAYGFTILMSRT